MQLIPASIRHIFFDLDHTLWDFETNSKNTLTELYWSYALEQHGITLPEFLEVFKKTNARLWAERRIGKSSKENIRTKRFNMVLAAFGVQDKRLAMSINEAYVKLGPQKSGLMPNAHMVLNVLKDASFNLHIISNGFKSSQAIKIKSSNLEAFFTTITTSEDAQALKPDLKIYTYAMKVAGAKPSESIYVGDHYTLDYKPAEAAGMSSILYDPELRVDSAGGITVIRDLKELLM